ncbi:MAG: carboxypeptidase-like regulatory domain-containing protein [Acidobacteriota bacterium]|nr:carboxypeptidase-like regulatory domain-containing protein [Acidobacteriota bacterium]
MRQLFLLAIICAPAAWACSCAGYPSAKDAWLDSPLVFVGFVKKTDPKITSERGMSGEQTTWVGVTEPFKGVKKDQVLELRDQFSSCFGGFREGTALLFYLYPGQKKDTWVAPACHRSRSINDAADDLKFLYGLPASARGNRVSGTVQLWEDDPVKGFHMSRELGEVHVRAIGASGSYATLTDTHGLYEFRDLRPGTYAIKIDYPKRTVLRFPIAFGKTGLQRRAGSYKDDDIKLDVTDESGNGFDFVLSPDTRITGRVLGPAGSPMKDVCLDIEPLQSSSENASRIFACTKPDGSYVLDKMSAGSYRIVANRTGQMTAAAPFGRLYYPGTPDTNKAGVLTIAAGQHLDGIDFRISELARRIELRGRLSFSNGVPLVDQSLDFQGDDGRYRQYGRTDRDGNFVMQTSQDDRAH